MCIRDSSVTTQKTSAFDWDHKTVQHWQFPQSMQMTVLTLMTLWASKEAPMRSFSGTFFRRWSRSSFSTLMKLKPYVSTSSLTSRPFLDPGPPETPVRNSEDISLAQEYPNAPSVCLAQEYPHGQCLSCPGVPHGQCLSCPGVPRSIPMGSVCLAQEYPMGGVRLAQGCPGVPPWAVSVLPRSTPIGSVCLAQEYPGVPPWAVCLGPLKQLLLKGGPK